MARLDSLIKKEQYVCKCGKVFKSAKSYAAHCGHCDIHLGRKPIDRSWNRKKLG